MAEELKEYDPQATGSSGQAQVGEESAVRLMHLQTQAREAEEATRGRAGRFRGSRAPWWQTWSWLLLTMIAIVGFALALAGGRGGFGTRLGDALALFPSAFPSSGSRADRSTAFVVAMYLAPVVALWVTASVVVALYARHWNELRARRRSGHAVVCGLGEKGLRSARALLHEGFKVTGIDLDGTSQGAVDIRARGGIVLEGDATHLDLLKTARTDQAAVVVCACLDDSANASIASQVERLTRRRNGSPMDVYVHLANPVLSGALRAPTFGLDRVRLHFFNIYELWAQALVTVARLEQLGGRAGVRPHMVVVGSTGLARSLLISAAQRWYRLCTQPVRRLRITLIANDATTEIAALSRRYPALPRTTELIPVDQPVDAANPIDPSVFGSEEDLETTMFLCLYDDAENLSVALQAQHHMPIGSRVVVPASAWTAELAGLLLRGNETICAVGYTDDPDSLDVLRDSRRELMAREVHSHYLVGDDASSRASVDWDHLPEDLRESNRLQVDAIDDHIRALWYEIGPLVDWDRPPIALSDATVDLLAQLEHLRWYEEKSRQGYVHGDGRPVDAGTPTHPDFLPWNELTEAARDKDRSAVGSWPPILFRAGYTLELSTRREQLAQAIHERHVRDRAAAGESADTNPLLVPWRQLTEEQRELNRSSADHIAVKLAMIGYTIAPASAGAPIVSFTDSQLDELAVLEHDRWQRERISQGWRKAHTRDDAAKTHPDLVPWNELPEARRQIDRDHVGAIPELLAVVGLRLVRRSTADAA